MIKIRQTTARVTPEEKALIQKAAARSCMTEYNLVNEILDMKLPVKNLDSLPRVKREITLGLFIPDDIRKKMDKNIKELSTRFKRVTMQDFIVSLVIGELKG